MEARNSTENITWVNKILLAIFVDSVRKFGGGGGGRDRRRIFIF